MGSYGSSSSATQVWGPQQKYLKNLFSRAEGLYGQGNYEYYPGSTVAGFDPSSAEAFRGVESRARAGSEGVRQAQDEQMRTSRGDYLDPESNPWLTKSFDLAARDIGRNYYGQVNALGSRMEAAGRTGGGAQASGSKVAQENYARGLGQLGADLYGGAYQFERGQQARAGASAGGLADYDYRDLSALRGVGAQREQQAQRTLDDLVARFDFNQRGAADKLAEFASMIGGPVMESKSRQTNIGIMSCWVAAELFGWFTPKFLAARRWLLEQWQGDEADEFREYYVAHGRELADEIAHDDNARAQWLPFFEWAAEQGA